MFIAGAVVGVVGVVVAGHTDYSDCHGNYSRYGDASLQNDIQEKEMQIQQVNSELQNIKRLMKQDFENCFQGISLEAPELLPQDIQNRQRKKYYCEHPDEFKQIIQKNLQEKLEEQIAGEQAELEKIDGLLNRINTTVLTKK